MVIQSAVVRFILVLLWLCPAFSFASQAQESRSMHWDALEVDARLDADGRLHVSELQSMVFNGAWNGGERRFTLYRGQTFELTGLARVDAQGQSHPLTEGDLDAIDEYRWTDSATLRWRSRLSKDPAFRNAAFTYRIDYVLSGILRFENEQYVLDHDFAFSDRPGIIKRFVLRLALDPVWSPDEPLPDEMRVVELKPGDSVVVQRNLRYAGTRLPAAVSHEPVSDQPAPNLDESLSPPAPVQVPLPTRIALAAAMVVAGALLLLIFSWRESRVGRFRPLLPLEDIDRAWLDKHVYVHLPEVVGVLWDCELGSTEVAAVLARMTQEGKLASRVEKGGVEGQMVPNLHLELKVPRDSLSGHEAELIDALFVNGKTTTSTEKIQAYYDDIGFNPVSKIASIKWDVQRLVGMTSDASFNIMPFVALIVISIIMLPVYVWLDTRADYAVNGTVMYTTIFYAGFALLAVKLYRRNYASWFVSMAGLLAVAAVFSVPVLVLILYDPLNNSVYLFIELVMLWIAALGAMLHNARTREEPRAMEQRRLMSSARAWFKAELKKSEPSLDDVRYPYLIALGLGRDINNWVQTFRAGDIARPDRAEEVFGSSAGSSGNHTWSGGGGAFGGAGASGSWAIAASGISARIADSSERSSSGSGFSDSSSSSSRSSSSSSGGGGGGGW